MLRNACDRFDRVVQTLEMLNVERGHHIDSRFEQLLDVFPSLLVAAAGYTPMSQFIHQHHARAPGQDRIDVKLLKVVPR